MATQHGTIRVQQHEHTVTFQPEGDATMHHSPSVRRFAEQCLADGMMVLYVDLRHCTHMDSTFLGTLLFLKRLVERREEGKFALLSPSPQSYRLLQQMGLNKVFPIVSMEDSGAGAWAELTSDPKDTAAFKQNVVQAHQELGRLEGPAGETFRELASSLASELESEERERQHGKR
jgi:anti-anti-sigma factor